MSCRGSGCTAQPHAAASGVQLVSNLRSDKLLGASRSAGRVDGEQAGSAEVKGMVFGKWSECSFTLSNEWRLRGDTQGPGRGRVRPAGGAELSRPRPAPGSPGVMGVQLQIRVSHSLTLQLAPHSQQARRGKCTLLRAPAGPHPQIPARCQHLHRGADLELHPDSAWMQVGR